jgi:catechol 2,3-dioxygenase-like lactoylglutathione lyase family enzyme
VSEPAPLRSVLETCLYHTAAETEATEAFYLDTLGLPEVSRWPGGLALRLGAGVLLLFEREALDERASPIADHGSVGPGHVCLLAPDPAAYDGWLGRVRAAGVEVTHEHSWDQGLRSFYFRDPGGNLVEIADGDLWPR